MDILKTIGAIVAGFFTVVILSIGTDTILEKIQFFPPIGAGLMSTSMLAIALAYRSVYTILGGFVTAWISGLNAKRNVVILGSIGTVAGIAGAYFGWNLSEHWYPIAIAATGFLFTWIGGRLYLRLTGTQTV